MTTKILFLLRLDLFWFGKHLFRIIESRLEDARYLNVLLFYGTVRLVLSLISLVAFAVAACLIYLQGWEKSFNIAVVLCSGTLLIRSICASVLITEIGRIIIADCGGEIRVSYTVLGFSHDDMVEIICTTSQVLVRVAEIEDGFSHELLWIVDEKKGVGSLSSEQVKKIFSEAAKKLSPPES